MNKIKTKNFESSLIKLESHNPILKSRSFSFSPLNLAGKIIIKINNNYINNNPNININNIGNNQRSSIKTISKIEESETSSREMNYFELFPSPQTPHLNNFNESTNENDYNSTINNKNFTYGLLNYNKNYFYNNKFEKNNNVSLLNNTINFENNSNNINEKIKNVNINDNNNYYKSNEIPHNFSKFKKKDLNLSSTNNIQVIERKISIPSRLRRRVQFNLDSKLLIKESSLSLSKLEIKKNKNKNRSLINMNKNKISLNDSKLLKNSLITFKNKNSNISSNLSIKNFPMFSKNVLIKNFDYYFNKNKPLIFPNSTKNKIITSFCAYTYKNGMDETKTKININLKDLNKNIYSFFTLHSNEIEKEEINQIYDSISKLKSKNNVFINQVNKLYKNLKSDCLTILFKNKKIYSFYNCIKNDEKNINYKAILSNDNGFSIQIIKLNNRNLKIINNFDFIILINKTIFDVLSNQQIIKLIYMVLKYSIINDESYETFLSKIIETIFKEVIHKGVMLNMSFIFITFDNIKKIYDKKIITQINETLKNLENLDLDFDFNYNDYENSPQREIKVRNNFNLTFKDNKSIQSENTLKKKFSKIYLNKNSENDYEEDGDNKDEYNHHKTEKKKKSKSFLCGLFC